MTSAMKTTVEIHDKLLARAKRHARRSGRSLRSVVEEGLRLVLDSSAEPSGYELKDLSVGDAGDPDPLEALSWQDLRAEIYGDPKPG